MTQTEQTTGQRVTAEDVAQFGIMGTAPKPGPRFQDRINEHGWAVDEAIARGLIKVTGQGLFKDL